MSCNYDSYSARMAFALLVDDQKQAAEICAEAMKTASGALLRLIEQRPKADLPFWLASMRILSTYMLNVLNDSGRDMVETLTKITSAVVIEKEGFQEQLRQEVDP